MVERSEEKGERKRESEKERNLTDLDVLEHILADLSFSCYGGNGNACTAPPIDAAQPQPWSLLRRHISEIINYSHGGTNQTHTNRQSQTSLRRNSVTVNPQTRTFSPQSQGLFAATSAAV